jgi:hypothetical protein
MYFIKGGGTGGQSKPSFLAASRWPHCHYFTLFHLHFLGI